MSNSRDKILAAVKNNQPSFSELPDISGLGIDRSESRMLADKFLSSLQTIGGHCKKVSNYNEISETIKYQFPDAKRIVTSISELNDIAEVYCATDVIESADNIDVAVLSAHFGVAENGAVWLTEDIMCDRVLPFICQHLVVVISADNIVPNMHEAYKTIGNRDSGFSIFIAGPSKTADIEQSLVLGAHGPISMTVFILE
ncbi:MAG: LUD domain-containing protein [Chitinophagaceae bacterium]|nr:LUD domain-containing protein [Chitinophagaceae bacterium]